MNLKNFNNRLLKELQGDTVFKKSAFSPKIFNSPIFSWQCEGWDQLQSEPNNAIDELLQNEQNVLPFPELRVFVEFRDDIKNSLKYQKFWMVHKDGNFEYIGETDFRSSGLRVFTHTSTKGQKITTRVVSYLNGDYLEDLESEDLEELVKFLHTCVCWFIREVSSPSNFIAKRHPHRPFKSVEWCRSREHYVILDRKHPANARSVAVGSKVEDNRTLSRQAHTRRAHARILRHPRFGDNIGKLIRVAATWVGPREWKCNNSVYKLV
jgi:hypothetical protein